IIFTGIMLGAVPGLLLLLASITTKKAGTADGIVLLMLGMLTDYRSGVRTFCLSMMIAAVFAIITLALKKVGKDSELPYIPFLTVAFAINCLSVI
ncbi:MAG: hypothetical protein LUG83_02490, partial [Lachnospiraceae bacterium]|nr:hypothetical protein [Lachnospiraceae bacterium]